MAKITKKSFDIEGMHCNSCASGIQMVLQGTDGVLNASANYESKKGEVEYDEEKTNLENIVKAIEQLGYKATVEVAESN
jgi:copper chaperone CopZ